MHCFCNTGIAYHPGPMQKQLSFNFSEVYNTYAPLLYGFILAEVRDEQIAERLLRKTFNDAFAGYHSYDERKLRLFSWLRQIAAKHLLCICAVKKG